MGSLSVAQMQPSNTFIHPPAKQHLQLPIGDLHHLKIHMAKTNKQKKTKKLSSCSDLQIFFCDKDIICGYRI